MITVYVNYPNPHITIHANERCSAVRQQHKPAQRIVRLDAKTLSAELQRFEAKEYRFGANPETNDMWLYIEFADLSFERAGAEYVRKLLAAHYAPFGRVRIDEHCQAAG